MKNNITIDMILDFYDVPQLFIGRNSIGTRFMCLLVDDNDEYTYIAVPISQDRLNSFFTKKEDLRSIFVSPEIIGAYYMVRFQGDTYYYEAYKENEIPEQFLPETGYFYSGSADNAEILCESSMFHHPVIHLGFVDQHNSHSIPVNVLSTLTSQYQSIVTNCYRKISGSRGDRDFNLRVFAFSAASFNVHMYAESDFDLLGTSKISETLYTVNFAASCTTNVSPCL